jgi:hypothetical protein
MVMPVLTHTLRRTEWASARECLPKSDVATQCSYPVKVIRHIRVGAWASVFLECHIAHGRDEILFDLPQLFFLEINSHHRQYQIMPRMDLNK